ncbi:DNA cytosine methyltransferase [Shouchella lonarensis]|uniref:DNA (Cytosine-5)-methyltransferase 1 n=1 Tax=Shouchella lonarensis TaxID=1464122 RepID=A0A1G6HQV1_9BACI|nr:DNA cytosine methyltransferase [Shouchella lonarensis]SDB96677.1 DNA (cytosine-5)-methyltransferase 1 [Shouchella lonarensis]
MEVRAVASPRVPTRNLTRHFKNNDEAAFTLTRRDHHGVAIGVYPNYYIRRFTPLECWRLQGFPDAAHETVKNAGVSETQRYFQAGNAVTVNVIDAIVPALRKYVA